LISLYEITIHYRLRRSSNAIAFAPAEMRMG
jgi:hypothetical protein